VNHAGLPDRLSRNVGGAMTRVMPPEGHPPDEDRAGQMIVEERVDACAFARPFRVLSTCEVFEPGYRGGGPIRSLSRLIESISSDIDLRLVTRDRDLGSSSPYPELSGKWIERSHSRVFYLNTSSALQWIKLWRALRRTSFHVLYVNSLWNPLFTLIPIAARGLRLIRAEQVLIAPRGELASGALALKSVKKRLLLKVLTPVLRRMKPKWHASSRIEECDIKETFPWASVLTFLPEQANLPPEPMPPEITGLQGPSRLVFLSRIAPVKNLALVLRALAKISGPVHFDIYGPIEAAKYWALCQSLIKQLPGGIRVRYRGEVEHSDVPGIFVRYDTFVFPTAGENFGHVIAESLSASCPVICSNATPWTEVLAAGGGAILPALNEDALAAEIERVAAMTSAQRLQARRVAGDCYRAWRQSVRDVNILNHICETP